MDSSSKPISIITIYHTHLMLQSYFPLFLSFYLPIPWFDSLSTWPYSFPSSHTLQFHPLFSPITTKVTYFASVLLLFYGQSLSTGDESLLLSWDACGERAGQTSILQFSYLCHHVIYHSNLHFPLLQIKSLLIISFICHSTIHPFSTKN